MSRTEWLLQVAMAHPEVPLVAGLSLLVVWLGLREPKPKGPPRMRVVMCRRNFGTCQCEACRGRS